MRNGWFARLGEYDLVIGARNGRTQATLARRAGNALLNAFAGYLTGRRIDDLTSGFRAARREHLLEFLHLLPNGFSTPTTTTLAFMKAGYNVAFEPIDARQRVGTSKIKLAQDGAKFFVIILKIVTLFSPLRVFLPIALATFTFGVRVRHLERHRALTHPERCRAADPVLGRRLPCRARVRADRRPSLRRRGPIARMIGIERGRQRRATLHSTVE